MVNLIRCPKCKKMNTELTVLYDEMEHEKDSIRKQTEELKEGAENLLKDIKCLAEELGIFPDLCCEYYFKFFPDKIEPRGSIPCDGCGEKFMFPELEKIEKSHNDLLEEKLRIENFLKYLNEKLEFIKKGSCEIYKVGEEEFNEDFGDYYERDDYDNSISKILTIEQWLKYDEKVSDYLWELENKDIIRKYRNIFVEQYHLINKFNVIAKRHNKLIDENEELKKEIENLKQEIEKLKQ